MRLEDVNKQYTEPTVTGKPHATTAEPDGYHKVHPTRRNRLNKGGTRRVGTLGYRLNDGTRTRAQSHNPRIGKVQPPAPITKSRKPSLEYVMGDSWNTTNLPEAARQHTGYHWRGRTFDTFEDMQTAIERQ